MSAKSIFLMKHLSGKNNNDSLVNKLGDNLRLFKKNFKTIYLMGGLGNILFQLNFAYNMRDAGYKIRLNTYAMINKGLISKLLKWSNHNTLKTIYELDLMSDFEVENIPRLAFFGALLSKKTNVSSFGSKFYGINSPSPIEVLHVKNLFGYFQNENPINESFVRFVRMSLEIWLGKKPNLQELINKLIERDDVVAHVRGLDFTLDSDLELGANYYYKAVLAVRKNPINICVVTNDISYTKSILKNLPFTIISQDTVVADFVILMKAPTKILANSTFSWWAAELGDDNCRIIEVNTFYPQKNWRPYSKKQRFRISTFTN